MRLSQEPGIEGRRATTYLASYHGLANLGHFYYSGCFRCHDGQHVSADGKVVSKDCSQCHTLMSQTEGTATAALAPAPSFQHPVDIGDLTQVNCADCHTGGVGP